MKDDVQIWRYYLPPVDGLEGWGVFILDSRGFFAAVSDYGNYAYLWAHHGCNDFREFVVGLVRDWDYLLRKIAPNDKKYDGNKTVKHIKRHLLQSRWEGYYSKEFIRREWALLNQYKDELQFHYGFIIWCRETELEDAYEFEIESYSTDEMNFAQKLIPRLAEVLKTELTTQREPSP